MSDSLRKIDEVSISSTVSSIDIANVFTNDFDTYKVTIENLQTDTTAYGPYMRLIDSNDNVIINAVYRYAVNLVDPVSGNQLSASSGATSFQKLNYYGTTAPFSAMHTLYFFRPYDVESYTNIIAQGAGSFSGRVNNPHYVGTLPQAKSITGFQLLTSNASYNFEAGTIRVYGLRVDS